MNNLVRKCGRFGNTSAESEVMMEFGEQLNNVRDLRRANVDNPFLC